MQHRQQLTDKPDHNPLQTLSDVVAMLPTTTSSPPNLGDYIPIEEYQSQTPETFFGGKPVLHRHVQGVKAWLPLSNVAALPIFANGTEPAQATAPSGTTLSAPVDGVVERTVDIFVNSENLTIFSTDTNVGLAIPYPSISIHAVKQIGTLAEGAPLQAIWMQLEFTSSHDDDDAPPSSIDLTIVPPASADVQALYDAISACSDLHPDPAEGDDDDDDENDRIVFEGEHEALDGFTGVMRGSADGALPPPFPGSSGWITAENVHEYFDQDGNWIRGGEQEEGVSGELGDGAGRVRTHDEVNGHEGGAEGDDAENKRPRVDDPPAS